MGNTHPSDLKRQQAGQNAVLIPNANQRQASSTIHRGLFNNTGLFNCFLNVVIQTLWHIKVFRRRFVALDYNHVHRIEPCLFCALRTIFTQYQFSDENVIPPDVLRKAMSDLSSAQFQLNQMADAEECLNAILRWLHCDQVGITNDKDNEDVGCSPPCISHTVFGEQLCDLKTCECGATDDPQTSQSFMYRVYVNEFNDTYPQFVADAYPNPHHKDADESDLKLIQEERHGYAFCATLKHAYASRVYECPSNSHSASATCSRKARIQRWALGIPKVFGISLAWPQARPSKECILSMLNAIPRSFYLHDLLQIGGDSRDETAGVQSDTDAKNITGNNTRWHFRQVHTEENRPKYVIRGMILYYGRHYMSIFYSDAHKCWIMFDDKRVRTIGDWNAVLHKCTSGRLQPVVIVFEKLNDGDAILPSAELARSMASTWQKDMSKAEIKQIAHDSRQRQQLHQQQLQQQIQPVPQLFQPVLDHSDRPDSYANNHEAQSVLPHQQQQTQPVEPQEIIPNSTHNPLATAEVQMQSNHQHVLQSCRTAVTLSSSSAAAAAAAASLSPVPSYTVSNLQTQLPPGQAPLPQSWQARGYSLDDMPSSPPSYQSLYPSSATPSTPSPCLQQSISVPLTQPFLPPTPLSSSSSSVAASSDIAAEGTLPFTLAHRMSP